MLIFAGDRGLAGAFNSNAVRAGVASGREHQAEGREPVWFAIGAPPGLVAGVPWSRGGRQLHRLHRPPRLRRRTRHRAALMAAYVDGEVDQVDIFYNGYVSALQQVIRRETLLPLASAPACSTRGR